MAKHLINDKEALALHNLLKQHKSDPNPKYDLKIPRATGNFPFRFKLLEAMGATTAHKANANIWFIGDESTNVFDTDYVVDDLSAFQGYPINTVGTCIYSTEYCINNILSSKTYMGLAITDYTSDSTSITIDNLEPMDGVGTTLTQLTAKNKFNWQVYNDKFCCIKYNCYTSCYDLIQTWC